MRIVFSERARMDMREQTDFIASDKPNAALDVCERIESAIRRLADFPRLGCAGSREGTFEIGVPKTPFVVIYRLSKDSVVILRIRHSARNWR